MNRLHEIRLIAAYETKGIVRDVTFWIIALVILAGCPLFYMWLTRPEQLEGEWIYTSSSSSIPYALMQTFNFLQTLLTLFVGTGFLWRAKNAQAMESLQTRVYTNGEWFAGKGLALAAAAFGLQCAVMMAAVILQIDAGDAAIRPEVYAFYALTLTLPTFLLLTGVCWFLATLTRNKAAYLLTAAATCGGLAYLSIRGGSVDVWAFDRPMLFSDVTGFPLAGDYMAQRTTVALAGMAFMVAGAGMHARLTSRPRFRRRAFAVMAVLLLGAGGIWFARLQQRDVDMRQREAYRAVYDCYLSNNDIRVVAHDIDWTEEADGFSARSEMTLRNEGETTAENIVFYLNPGLGVERVEAEGESVEFKRDGQAVVVRTMLPPDGERTLAVEYTGSIDERVCYLHVPDKEFLRRQYAAKRLENKIFRTGGSYACLTRSHILLTPEQLWYPTVYHHLKRGNTLFKNTDFTRFRLKARVTGGKTVLAPGKRTKEGGSVIFEPDAPLRGLPLCAGEYEERSIVVDSLRITIYTFKNHDWFLDDYPSDDEETLKSDIREIIDNFTYEQGSPPPLRHLRLVETPMNIQSFEHPFAAGSELTQAEIIFFPECLATLPRLTSGIQIMYNPDDEEESKRRMYIETNCQLALHSGLLNVTSLYWDQRIGVEDENGMNFTPLFRLLNKDIGQAIGASFENFKPTPLYQDLSMEDIANMPHPDQEHREMAATKMKELSNMLHTLLPGDSVCVLGARFMQKHLHRHTPLSRFVQILDEHTDGQAGPIFQSWTRQKGLPLLVMNPPVCERHEKDGEDEYFVSLTVHNPSPVNALLSLGKSLPCELGNQILHLLIPAQSYKEIRFPLAPRFPTVFIATNLSANLPNTFYVQTGDKADWQKTSDTWTGMRDADSNAFRLPPGTFIVDNEDEGFSTEQDRRRFRRQAPAPKLVIAEHPAIGGGWDKFITDNAYGQGVLSYHAKMAGTGKNFAIWKQEISQTGRYEIQVHLPQITVWSVGSSHHPGSVLHYTVECGTLKRDVAIELDEASPEWVSLGVFDLDTGKCQVRLSDKGGENLSPLTNPRWAWSGIPRKQIIVADAVKWKRVAD